MIKNPQFDNFDKDKFLSSENVSKVDDRAYVLEKWLTDGGSIINKLTLVQISYLCQIISQLIRVKVPFMCFS